jgi:serine/threonine protein kinase
MVVKEDIENTAADWFDQRNWRERRPREVKVSQLLEERRGHGAGLQHIVGFRGYRLFMRQRRLRQYLEYCDGGDLFSALRHMYRYYTDAQSRGQYRFDQILMRQWLPESLLWKALHDLVVACLVMQQGDANQAQKDWKPLTHRDLHQGNVMLRMHPDNIKLVSYNFLSGESLSFEMIITDEERSSPISWWGTLE